MNKLQSMVICAMMAALGLTLPMVFHLSGLGNKFLPIFLPLLLNGFLVPLPWAVLTGFAVPIISSLLTGMPPLYPPVAIVMAVEGAMLAGIAALLYRFYQCHIWVSLILAIIAGRATTFVLSGILADFFGIQAALVSFSVLLQSFPGVLLQIIVVPMVLKALANRKGILFDRCQQY